jgi:hypothetical protein
VTKNEPYYVINILISGKAIVGGLILFHGGDTEILLATNMIHGPGHPVRRKSDRFTQIGHKIAGGCPGYWQVRRLGRLTPG